LLKEKKLPSLKHSVVRLLQQSVSHVLLIERRVITTQTGLVKEPRAVVGVVWTDNDGLWHPTPCMVAMQPIPVN